MTAQTNATGPWLLERGLHSYRFRVTDPAIVAVVEFSGTRFVGIRHMAREQAREQWANLRDLGYRVW